MLPWALACLGVHTLMDSAAGIQNLVGKGLSQTAAYGIIYLVLTAAAVGCAVGMVRICRSWSGMERFETVSESEC